MSGSSGMRWIKVLNDPAFAPRRVLVAAPGGMGDDGEIIIPLVGHTWSQSDLNQELSDHNPAGGSVGPAVGDAIERRYLLERIVGDVSWFPSSFDGSSLFWLIRAGFIVYASDSDLGVTPLSLVGTAGQAPVTADFVTEDLEGPWVWLWQTIMLNYINEEPAQDAAVFNPNNLVTTHIDIRVNRLIDIQDILCFQVYAGSLSSSTLAPTNVQAELQFWGQLRALVKPL